MRRYCILAGGLFLYGCGGDDAPPPSTSNPPSEPTLAVTLSPSATAQEADDTNSKVTFTLEATYIGSSSDAIVPVIEYDDSFIRQSGAFSSNGKTFSTEFETLDGLLAGDYSSTIRFRLCKETACSTVYPGSSKTFTYSLDVAIAPWTNRQRNAAHNGYVRAKFDPATISQAWQYVPSGAYAFNEVSARGEQIFATYRSSDGRTKAVALRTSTGSVDWNYDLGEVHYGTSGPSLAGDKLLIATMVSSSGNNKLVALNADTGSFLRNMIFASQWSTFAPPAAVADSVYLASGYYGNVVYGWNLSDYTKRFEASGSAGDVWDGQTPAVDEDNVYYYSGNLDVVDRLTGTLIKSIDDPEWVWNGYSYGGTPMLGADGSVTAFSGTGQGSYPNVGFKLVNFDVAANTHRWHTADAFHGIPAVANGTVYAFSNETSQLAAINETNGATLFAVPRPSGQEFRHNIIVTENLLFFSGSSSVYAVDLETKAIVWEANTPGQLAIGPDNQLLVASPNTGVLTAYRLEFL